MKKTMRKSLEQAGNDVEKLEKEIEEHKKFHSNIVDSVKVSRSLAEQKRDANISTGLLCL